MKIISNNKKAKYDYFLSADLEVGIVLKGSEIKHILSNGINLKESYVKIIDNTKGNSEVFLINANISGHNWGDEVKEYPMLQNVKDYSLRPKKLLLHKSQIKKFLKLTQEKSTTLIMRNMYLNDDGILKGTLCVGKGKKQYDKRQTIKERDLSRS